MKKTLFALALVATFSLSAFAQGAPDKEHTPEQRAEKMTERMAKQLDLTEDQKTAVYDANFQMASSKEENRKSNMDKHDANMKVILTEEQYEKWKAARKEHKGNRPKGRRPN